MADEGYILGYDAAERRRLDMQADMAEAATRTLLSNAGLSPGMRVLDVGCGTGAVTAIAAEIVGPMGHVVGVDRDGRGFPRGEERAAARGFRNVSFAQSALPGLEGIIGTFDAVVGRLVLMYSQDPRDTLARLVERVRPGGIVAFGEIVWTSGCSVPAVPSVTDAYATMCEAFRRSGLQTAMGDRIAADFDACGMTPTLSGTQFIEFGGRGYLPELITDLARSCLPAIVATGAATAEDVGVETLEGRIREELSAAEAVVRAPTFVGCWARRP